MKKWRCLRIMILTCCYGLASFCRADILNFDSPPVVSQQGYGPGESYIEDGFRFSTTNTPGHFGGSIIRFDPANQIAAVPNNGTIYFGDTYDSSPIMDRLDGAVFNIMQIDLAYYSEYVITNNITFQGMRVDGSSVTTTFTLSGPFDGQFHRFEFGADWTDLRSVKFLTEGFAWDNISASLVPEPTCFWLVATGVVIFCSFARVPPVRMGSRANQEK